MSQASAASQLKLVIKNIVLGIDKIPPELFSQNFFVKNGLVDEIQIKSNSFFTNHFCQLITDNFWLTILPDQLTFTFLKDNTEDLIHDVLIKYLLHLENVSFTAVGLNMIYSAPIFKADQELSRKFFYPMGNSLSREFDSDDARFGLYLSKNYKDFRLKLDIKPASISINDGERMIEDEEQIVYSFNYHKDLNSTDKKTEVVESITKWSLLMEYSNNLLSSFYSSVNV